MPLDSKFESGSYGPTETPALPPASFGTVEQLVARRGTSPAVAAAREAFERGTARSAREAPEAVFFDVAVATPRPTDSEQ